ncbi:uncharacterized protein Z520_07361 [Fonsecaea multimorphosa CBS 102226]|uniref:Transcription factor domain-containing protein n=1 Tax=Fonsecaea multimorphosa CBS 102226 TaxID=1442371 RepID=A0A0D2IJK7_9EURO|nr:uncharacterized protein Z520_07361 [Fonsecaea multimorphosa CBS 102226]KIX97246.1 hypothetical protein Z520_07361 [Fonsecaea multimorphosa CBS 102226]OAL23017.1 hypothetical protein AYO22_06925 [Fonsecaea multimorphosa]
MTVTSRPLVRSNEDNRAEEFFQIQTITQWTEFFKSELWDRYVLQLSLTEPCLQHAKLALGAMHRSLTTDATVKEYGLFAIQQYNKAISYVVRPSKPLQPIVILVACWMFSCFEVMRGDHKVLGRHLTSGLQLISSRSGAGHGDMAPEYAPDTNAENRAIWDCLIQQFSLLDLQMTIYEPDWIAASMQYYQQPGESFSFSSISQARRHLTALLLRVIEIKRLEMRQLAGDALEKESIPSKRQTVLADLDRWSIAFESFVGRGTRTPTKEDVRAGQLLQIQHLAGSIHLSVTASDEEISYDKHLPKFQKLVSLSRALMERLEISSMKPPKIKKFLYEHGVIPSLYLAGYKCRDPVVRREAHSQLASIQRKEGMWDSDLMAKVVGHIITVEESNRLVCSSSDIPEEGRVWREFIHAGESSEPWKVIFEFRLNDGNGTRLVERSLD